MCSDGVRDQRNCSADGDGSRGGKRAATLLAAAHRREAITLLEAFAANDIYPIVFKGLAFAHVLYDDPIERPHSDIDLLVSERQFARALAVAETCGYVAAVETTDAAVKGQRDLRKPGAVPIAIDLHCRLVNPALFDAIDGFAVLSQRAQPVPALGPHGRTLSDVDALLHAAVHRVAHHYRTESPFWLKDIDLLARKLAADDWQRLRDRARTWRVSAVLLDGLRAAHGLYSTPLEPIRDWAVAADEPSRVLLEGSVPSELKIQALSLWHAPGVAAKCRILRAHAFPSAPYMLASYATRARWRLPELYVRRLVSGVLRVLLRRSAG